MCCQSARMHPRAGFTKDSGERRWRVLSLRSRRAVSKRVVTLWKVPAASEMRGAARPEQPPCNGRRSQRDTKAPAPSSVPEFLRAFPSVGSSTPDREQRHDSRRRPRRDAPTRRNHPSGVIGRDCATIYPTPRRRRERSGITYEISRAYRMLPEHVLASRSTRTSVNRISFP